MRVWASFIIMGSNKKCPNPISATHVKLDPSQPYAFLSISFTESFEELIDFALENGAGTMIPFNMLLYVAHLPGVKVASGILFKIADQVCESGWRLADLLPAFIPAVTAAMTREDAVEMGEKRLGCNSIELK